MADIVGQRHITDILERAIKAGRVSHAYLLTGPRGVGKTSVARILAHQINDLPYSDDSTHLDIIEIDAASNNSVEDIRDLRERVQLAPVSAKKKIYIIDEVHMLSKSAFNALLKTLEEPPEHIVFILATTNVEKLPATIVSRTQRYGFRSITEADAALHLRHIADTERIKISDEALQLIATRGDGSFRDSISLLDQLTSLTDAKSGITVELIEASLGLAPTRLIEQVLAAVNVHDVATIASLLDTSIEQGISADTLAGQLTHQLRRAIITSPQLVSLLDSLLDVAKSSHPDIKLLTVLAAATIEQKQPKTAALASPILEVSATIAELTKQATRKKPVELKVDLPKADQQLTAAPAKDFSWESLIEHTRKEYLALFSVLSKCTPKLEGTELTLYTGNAFYKKKLDDLKYSTHLFQSLKDIGSYQLTVHTIPTPPPPKSSQAAAVAAIMGGGEEVSVTDALAASA
jgi:DNA polymerase-3 subunit gamma/tau